MLRYYIVKNHKDTKWVDNYFNTEDQKFSLNISRMTMFRDREDAEAFKHILEFYGHQGLTIREVG